MSDDELSIHKVDGCVHEISFKDEDDCSVRFIDPTEVRMEQDNVPDDVCGLIHVGKPPQNGTIWANPAYVTIDQAVELGLALLEAAAQQAANLDEDAGPTNRMTLDQRWRAHVIASGLQDSTFWVHKDPRWPNHFFCIECETGCGAWGETPDEAMRNYLDGNFDRPPDTLA
jgi:hypothetical protein